LEAEDGSDGVLLGAADDEAGDDVSNTHRGRGERLGRVAGGRGFGMRKVGG
jgi:hypothetical protein